MSNMRLALDFTTRNTYKYDDLEISLTIRHIPIDDFYWYYVCQEAPAGPNWAMRIVLVRLELLVKHCIAAVQVR